MRLRLLIAMTVLAGALVPAWSEPANARAVSPDRCRSTKPTYVHAFHVEAEWDRTVYRRTDRAIVTVTVTRPAHEDPADLGLVLEPPISVPVEGATVTTTVITGRYPRPYGYGSTDADGTVRFKIPLQLLTPGKYDVAHLAEQWTNEGGCPDIVEWGYRYEERVLTILP